MCTGVDIIFKVRQVWSQGYDDNIYDRFVENKR
jgi:hypothetical protein